MLSTTPWHLQIRHITNIPSGEHMLTAWISVITQTERQLSTHTYTCTHTHTLLLVGCVIFHSCLSAVFWSPQCSLMITLSLLLSSAFSQKMRTHTFVSSSTRPSLPNSPVLLESTSSKCFPASRSKDEREEKYSVGQRQRKEDERRKHKREVVGGEGGR